VSISHGSGAGSPAWDYSPTAIIQGFVLFLLLYIVLLLLLKDDAQPLGRLVSVVPRGGCVNGGRVKPRGSTFRIVVCLKVLVLPCCGVTHPAQPVAKTEKNVSCIKIRVKLSSRHYWVIHVKCTKTFLGKMLFACVATW